MKNNEFLFKQAIVEGLSCRIDSMVDAFEGEVRCTKKHIKTIEAIVKGRVTGNVVWTPRLCRVVALIIAALIALTGCAVAYREQIAKFFAKVTDIYIDLWVDDSDPEQKELEEIYSLCYVPEGYVLTESTDYVAMYKYIYTNETGVELVFDQIINNDSISSVTNENVESSIVIIDNYEVLIQVGKNVYVSIWRDDKYTMTISCSETVSQDDLEKMIRSIIVTKRN